MILLDCNFESYLTTLKNFNKQGTETQQLKRLSSMLGNIAKSVISYAEKVKKYFLIQTSLHLVVD